MLIPQSLQKGDLIALVSPAKAIESAYIEFAKNYLENQGFRIWVGEHAAGQNTYFSGTEEERASDFQQALDHPEVKAIVCNRGGYGSIHLFDRVNWANLLREPKWILGFSDITYFHLLANKLGIQSAHSTMPLNFNENTEEALKSMIRVLKGEANVYEWKSSSFNKLGKTKGVVMGGNLSLIYALLGTKYCPNFENCILFIEDVGEQYYHIDRMFYAFKYAGVWDKIGGLIVGGMTDMKDTAIATNYTIEELVLKHTQYRKIPIAFNAPVGHIPDNRTYVLGKEASLEITENSSVFIQ